MEDKCRLATTKTDIHMIQLASLYVKAAIGMSRNKVYKFRIYPTHKQKILIAKTIGCASFVFNYYLSPWNERYKKREKGLTDSICSLLLT